MFLEVFLLWEPSCKPKADFFKIRSCYSYGVGQNSATPK